jgi:ABC-type nitrate/sulfonate/bicarbonate transport system substrate-binding protein
MSLAHAVKNLILALFAFIALPISPLRDASAQEKVERDLVRVRASMPGVAVSFAPVELGVRKGIYREEGIDLELIVIRSNLALSAMMADEVDYILGFGGPTRAAARGAAIKLVMGIDTRSLWYLLVRPEIKAASDLRGKRIGVDSIKGTAQNAATTALEQKGVSVKDITWLLVGSSPARLQAMETRAVDAAVVAFPVNMMGRKMGFRELIDLGEAASAPTVGLAVAEKKLAQKPQEVRRMIRATIRSVRYFLGNKREAAELISRRFNFTLEEAADVYAQQAAVLTPDGALSEKGVALLLQFAREAGEKIADLPPAKILDTRLLQEVQSELGKFKN